MSGVAALFNVPTTPTELDVWASVHASHHRDINRAIYQLTQVALPEFVLEPINPKDTGVWEAQHQQMHQNQDAILGIDGFDLTGVDFTNPELLTGWIQLNSSEHFQAANTLGIG